MPLVNHITWTFSNRRTSPQTVNVVKSIVWFRLSDCNLNFPIVVLRKSEVHRFSSMVHLPGCHLKTSGYGKAEQTPFRASLALPQVTSTFSIVERCKRESDQHVPYHQHFGFLSSARVFHCRSCSWGRKTACSRRSLLLDSGNPQILRQKLRNLIEMVSRKRGREEMESSEPATELSLLDRLRNMWEFSNLMQYIFIFGKAVKIDEDFTIEVNPSPLPFSSFTSWIHMYPARLLI